MTEQFGLSDLLYSWFLHHTYMLILTVANQMLLGGRHELIVCPLCMQGYARTAEAEIQGYGLGELLSKPLGRQLTHTAHTAVTADTCDLGYRDHKCA